MQTGTWSFAQSFLVFLIIVFLSESISTRLRNYIPMPFLFGMFFLGGFSAGFLPKDLLITANMVTVGTIAFNVLVIHSGTMINIPMLMGRKKEAGLAILSSLIMTLILLILLPRLIGRNLALLAPGAVIGGGASCAIGSRWVGMKNPAVSFFPWMIFMLQGIVSVPVVTWAIRKEMHNFADRPPIKGGQSGPIPCRGKVSLVDRIPQRYKTTAYYMGTIMVLAVLNYTLQNTLLKNLNINLNITALILGMMAGNLGILDRAPLFKADSYGLLIISLMGLMANTIAQSDPMGILFMMLPAAVALLLGGLVLAICGFFLSRKMGLSPYAGLIITMNSIMGFPVNRMMAADATANLPEEIKKAGEGYLLMLLNMGTAIVSNGVSIIIISILVELI